MVVWRSRSGSVVAAQSRAEQSRVGQGRVE